MINKENLQLGDWVLNEFGEIQQVREIREDKVMLDYRDLYDYSDIDPIPLTAKVLESNGFRYHSSEHGMYGVEVAPYYELKGAPHIFCDGNPFSVWFEKEVCIKYVHQLQHVLKLCGIKKELVIWEKDLL